MDCLSREIAVQRGRGLRGALSGRGCSGQPGTLHANTSGHMLLLLIGAKFTGPTCKWLPLPTCTVHLQLSQTHPAA